MKHIRVIAVIFALLCTFILSACSHKQADISGDWERNDGLRVHVEKHDDGTFRGTITRSDKKSVYKEKNVKWLTVKKTNELEYDVVDVGNDGTTYAMHATIIGDELSLVDLIDGGEEGASQKWIRVKLESVT